LWAVVWLLAGIFLLVGSCAYASWVADRDGALKANGARVTAIVLADQPKSLRCGQVRVPVQFTLDGLRHTETLWVNGCTNALSKNDQVTLYVDPADPSSLVSDQSDNETMFAVYGFAVALILGLALPVCAVVRAVRLIRTRDALRAGPWVQRTVRSLTVHGQLRVDVPVLALTDVDPPELLVLGWPASRALSPDHGGTVVVARSHSGWTVVAPDPNGPPRGARAANERLAVKAMTALCDDRPGGAT
jgi:hypothetical protein